MKAYPSYKESGVEWIGKIPKQWGVKSLKYVANIETGNTPPKADEDNYLDGKHLWVKPDELTGFIPIYDSKEKITDKGRELARVVPQGSVLVCCIGTIGKFGIAGIDLSTNQQINSVTFNESYLQNFGKYVIAAAGEEHVRQSNSVVISILSKSRQANIAIPAPPLPEQQAIADFLDRKTAQIDALIEKKQRQIDLLHEQRTALINLAVTKGLNPNVKMKDSGVEWLGEIPSHWYVSKIKYLCLVSDGNHGEEYPEPTDFTDEENGVPFIRVTEFVGWNITKQGILYITKEKNESMRKGGLEENDILFVNRGSIGKVALVSKEFEGANLNSQIAYFRVQSPNLHYKYFLYFLVSGSFQNMISSLIHGGALVQLPLKRIVGLEVVCPPTEEQNEIINYLDSKTNQIDETIKRYSSEIELLQEYRTALISEAVTGKIDVRTVHESPTGTM